MTNVTQTPDKVKAALVAAAGDAVPLTFTYYAKGIQDTYNGSVLTMSWAEWAQRRRAAAATGWPSNYAVAHRAAEIESMDVTVEDAEILLREAVTEAKHSIPVEVGAMLTDGRRKDHAAQSLTWLFIDVDGVAGEDPVETVKALGKVLGDANINYFISESPTSGLFGDLRVHLYVQLMPVVLPSTAQSTPTLRDVKRWWMNVYRQATRAILSVVGLTMKQSAKDAEGGDASVDDMAQPCFVAHAPFGFEDRRIIKHVSGFGLDVERFVAALGEDASRPWDKPAADAAAAPAAPAAPAKASKPALQPTRVEAGVVAAPQGPTEGHTTGSLLIIALRHKNRLGRLISKAEGKYEAKCPWFHLHRTDQRQKLRDYSKKTDVEIDSSTVVYDNVTKYGEDGGWECKHSGCMVDGQKRTAADVLSWARREGVPLPDKAGWGGAETVADGEEDAETAKPAAKKRPRDNRPEIIVRPTDVAGMRDAAIQALAMRGDVFVHNDRLVELTAQGTRRIPPNHLLAVLGETARWVAISRSKGEDGEEGELVKKAAKVPRDVVGAVLDAGTWPGVNVLKAIYKHPPLLPDGRLITEPGYDEESRLLYQPDAIFSIPAHPTRDDALAAAERILYRVRNTNFCDANGKSIWLAFNMSLVARPAFPTVPNTGFDAAKAQAGKTSLVKCAFGLTYGRLPSLLPPDISDEQENRKNLPLWAQMPLVCFDNLKHAFASPVIDNAITSGRGSTRTLGQNSDVSEFEVTSTTWAMTGCNLSVGEDAASRTLIVRIDSPTTSVYDFDIDDEKFYAAHRPQHIADVLTILRAYIAAGRPQKNVPNFRFVEWSRLVRQAILWLGMPDPVGGKVVDNSAEAKVEAIRAVFLWRFATVGSEWQKPFRGGELNTDFLRDRAETDAAYSLRRKVADALSSSYGKKVATSGQVGNALQKLRDNAASLPAPHSGLVKLVGEMKGSSWEYRLEWQRSAGVNSV